MTKTATIRIYSIYGSSHIICDVLYRGKVLMSFDRRNLESHESVTEGLKQRAVSWITRNGFTNYKLC